MAETSLAVLGACRIDRALTARRDEAARDLASTAASGGAVELVPWEDWRQRLPEFHAVLLCTGAAEPILSAEDLRNLSEGRLRTICDLGQPPQSARILPEGILRFALDDLAREAEAATREHARALERLSEEADRAAEALHAEVTRAGEDAWRRLALARTSSVAREKAEAEARKIGIPQEELERFAASVLSTYLRPLVAAPAAHAERAFRILSGADGGTEDEDAGES
jgi:glutamyl-tRNA reductase